MEQATLRRPQICSDRDTMTTTTFHYMPGTTAADILHSNLARFQTRMRQRLMTKLQLGQR